MKRMSGIKQQTMLIALIPILLMTVLFGSYSIYARFTDADQALIEHSNLVSDQLAAASEYALFSGNITLLKQNVITALVQSEVKSILVLDANSNILTSANRKNSTRPSIPASVNSQVPMYQDQQILLIYTPILPTQINIDDFENSVTPQNTKALGAVIIEFSKAQLNSSKIEMLLINIAVMLGVIILSIITALWMARRISSPILTMGTLIDKMGSGNLNIRIPAEPAVQELNFLSDHINKMAQQLSEDREHLEQRILDATLSLRLKKEEAEKSNQQVSELNKQLSSALNELETIMEANPDLLYVFNQHGQLVRWNTRLEKFTGLTKDQLMNKNMLDFFFKEDWQKVKEFKLNILKFSSASLEARGIKHDGTLIYYQCNGVALKNVDGEIIGFTGTGRDISERMAVAERMQHMAHYDLLTDLPNRAMFSDRLQLALNMAYRDKKQLALMFIDLDGFKQINDTYGHNIGDALLKVATKQMLLTVRESDTLARIGGDEFMVLLPSIERKEDALTVAEKIRLALCQSMLVEGHTICISSSIGIAIYPEHGTNGIDLIKLADDAMYMAKASGRNIVKLYEN
jgi:diguanylate cyclase (GGDEF)-like protein/PAS domain S-box-containing protein